MGWREQLEAACCLFWVVGSIAAIISIRRKSKRGDSSDSENAGQWW